MAASAALSGKAGAGSDSKGGGRDGRRRRKKEIDGKVMKNKCRDEDHFNNLLQLVSGKERNKGGKRCKMMPIYEERVYNPWPLDKKEAVAYLVKKRVSKSRNVKLMTIVEDSDIGCGDLGRTDVRLDVLFEQKQEVINNEVIKNNRTTTAEKAEQTVSMIDGGEEDEVVENQLNQLMKENDKQFDTLMKTYDSMAAMMDEFTKQREVQFEELKTMLMEFKQRQVQEDISLMMKDGTEDESVDNNNRSSIQSLDAFDMESIDDVKLSHNGDIQKYDEQEQQEAISLTMKESTEDDKWSAGSERTCETDSTDFEEHEQEIKKIQMLDGTKRQNTEDQVYDCKGNRIATVRFLDLRASLEDPDDHKEKPLTCDMEPDIYRAQQWKLVYGRKRKKKTVQKRSLDNEIKHKPVPLSCDLEPDIAVMQREMILKIKLIKLDTRRLVDTKMHSMEPLSCDLEPDIVIMYNGKTKQRK